MAPFFKAYCYLRADLPSSEGPLECSEISFQATPEVLRQLAAFMLESAKRIEASQDHGGGHFHLQDEWKEWHRDYPDVIAVSPPADE